MQTPEDCKVIDLSHLSVTPGMIDAHVHASFFDWREIDKDPIYYSDAMRALAVSECARRALAGGFTTIRHIGWFQEDCSLDVKRAIEAGYIEGARMIVAPHLVCAPGSHGDSTQKIATNPKLSRFLESCYPTMGSGPDFFRDAIRHEAKKAAEYFKEVDVKEIEDYVERGLIRSFLFRYNNQTRTPKALMHQYSMLKADTMNKWKEAREKQDFEIFRPWLMQVFELKKQIALAINPDAPAFDTLVNINDEGTTCEEISREFDVLKVGLTELRSEIEKSSIKPDETIFSIPVEPVQIEAFSQRLARETGYEESRGGFNNRVVHAFTSFMGPRDSRVSTYQNGNLNMIFTFLHEAGHAMYGSGGNDRVNGANMWGGIEGSFQEAMARFNENIVGRSRAYWEYYYPKLQKEFSEFADVSLDDFYLSMNAVRPSLRRITADEVTYSLHVILRYELERDCFGGKLEVGDLANAWNDLSEKYLGIRPSNDTEGVLQDMHWAGDYIGYFQSYALGNIYCGQIREAILRDIPDFDNQLRRGDFRTLSSWLDKNIRQYGCCYTAGEMAKKITGKSLDAKPFLNYLEEKYRKLYQL